MLEGLLVEWMKVDLNMFKEKSKFTYNWNSIKEFKQNKDESKGWKAYKIVMVFKKVKVNAKGVRALIAWTHSPTRPRVKLWQKQWGPKWEEKDEASWVREPSKQGGGLKVK